MSFEQNKKIALRSIEDLWNRGNFDAIPELLAENYVTHQHSHPDRKDVAGPKEFRAFIEEFRRAFPDYHDTVEDIIAEGDKVALRFTSEGTHRGELMGIAPTNRRATWSGICIYRMEDGKIAETWVSWDMMGMLQQLGALGDFGMSGKLAA